MSGVKDGLVWWWDLNSADATITDQHSGLVLTRHQTPTTVVGGAPDGGDCISFGTAQGKYRNASVPKTIVYERGFSANCWAFSTSFSTFGNRLINHRDIAAPNWYFQMGVVHPTIGDWGEVFSAGGTIRSASSGVPASPLNTWVMLTYVDNGSTSSLYRNGVLVATGSTAIGALATANAPLAIGGHAWQTINDSQLDHRGRMAMAGVWDRPLTASEITWLFNSGTGRRYNSLTFGERDLGGEVLWICPSLDDIGAGTLVARDLTTNRNHGILTNMDPPTDWVPDTANGGTRALDFDGINDQVTFGTLPNVSTTACQAYWFRRGSASQYGPMVGVGTAGSDANRFVIQPWSDGQVYISFGGSSWGNFASNDTNWHHIAAVYDGTQTGNVNRLRVWLDGVPVTLAFTGTIPSSIGAFNSLRVGRTFSPAAVPPDPFGVGLLDDYRIFNRVLTQTEITALASQRGYQRPAVNGIGGEALWICPSLDTFGNGTLLARDLSNQRNHGTMTSMVVGDWISDTANGGVRAINFDAVTKIIDFPNAGLLEPQSTGSVSAWVRYSMLSQYGQVITKQLNSSVNSPFAIDNSVSGSQFRAYVANGASGANVNGSAVVVNTWYHVAFTWDGSTIRIYVNGSLISSASQTVNPQRGTGAVSIGNVRLASGSLPGGYNTGPLPGRVDDIRYFHRAISASEVAALASQRGYQLPSNTRRRRYTGGYGL